MASLQRESLRLFVIQFVLPFNAGKVEYDDLL
jgi:hypothetical protein